MSKPTYCCSRCKRERIPADEMGKNASRKDGLSIYCRACVNAYATARRVIKPIELRPCRECQTVFTPPHCNAHYCSESCRDARQERESKRRNKAWDVANRQRKYERKAIWKANNPDRVRAMRKRGYEKHNATERASHAAWMQRNREYFNSYNCDYVRQKAAICAAKQEPNFKREREDFEAGFALLSSLPGKHGRYYRAVAFGVPIGSRERVITQYFWRGDRWEAVVAPIVAPDVRPVAERIVWRERVFGAKKRMKSESEIAA